jgi:putative spermidine/putrescine transport system substrate-binding protein
MQREVRLNRSESAAHAVHLATVSNTTAGDHYEVEAQRQHDPRQPWPPFADQGGGVGVAATAFPFVWTPSRAAGKRIVVRDDGGIYTKAYGAVCYKPFFEKTGIEVVGVQANAEPTAQIKSMVDTGSYTWNMAKIIQPAILLLTSGGKEHLEKHHLESDPTIAKIPKQYMSPYGVGTNVYSTVLAYRTDAFKGRKAPSAWADLWNVKDFPGRRSMRKYPFDTIEEALMADGVPTSEVYPCNPERAFKSLDKVSKNSGEVAWSRRGPRAPNRRWPRVRPSASSGTRTSGAATTGRS